MPVDYGDEREWQWIHRVIHTPETDLTPFRALRNLRIQVRFLNVWADSRRFGLVDVPCTDHLRGMRSEALLELSTMGQVR